MKKIIAALKKKKRLDLIKHVQKAGYEEEVVRLQKLGSGVLQKIVNDLSKDTTDILDITFPDFCKVVRKLTRSLPTFKANLQSYEQEVNQALLVAQKGLENTAKALEALETNLALELADQKVSRHQEQEQEQEIFTYLN